MIPQETTQAIDNWLAANGGPRRFEPGCTINNDMLFAYMREKGFECKCTGWGHMLKVSVSKGRGRPKSYTFRSFLQFVDEYRVADGLEPFAPRRGRAA